MTLKVERKSVILTRAYGQSNSPEQSSSLYNLLSVLIDRCRLSESVISHLSG